jgi:hypothetical protein
MYFMSKFLRERETITNMKELPRYSESVNIQKQVENSPEDVANDTDREAEISSSSKRSATTPNFILRKTLRTSPNLGRYVRNSWTRDGPYKYPHTLRTARKHASRKCSSFETETICIVWIDHNSGHSAQAMSKVSRMIILSTSPHTVNHLYTILCVTADILPSRERRHVLFCWFFSST